MKVNSSRYMYMQVTYHPGIGIVHAGTVHRISIRSLYMQDCASSLTKKWAYLQDFVMEIYVQCLYYLFMLVLLGYQHCKILLTSRSRNGGGG